MHRHARPIVSSRLARTRLRFALLSAATIIGAGGCVIYHAVPPPVPFGTVSPKNFCPGDRIVASYDLTYGHTCDTTQPEACAASTPTIGIGIAPTSLPTPAPIAGFVGSREFEPEADDVAVTFSTGGRDGSRVISFPISRTPLRYGGGYVRDTTIHAQRLIGDIAPPGLQHDPMCVGGTVVYSPGIVPGPPQFSAGLRLRSICNRSAASIQLTIVSPSGGSLTPILAAGTCFPLEPPIAPPGFDRAGRYEVRSTSPQMCNPTQGIDPSPLRTSIVLACGN